MFIREIKIKNFRGITEFQAVMTNHMLSIVGQNDVGKSSVLKAIRIFFEDDKITAEDFPKHDPQLPVEIEMVLHIDDEVLESLKVDNTLRLKQIFHLMDGKITAKKSVYMENRKPSVEELDNYSQLKKIGIGLGVEFPDVGCLSRPEVCRRLVETESHMALCFFFCIFVDVLWHFL